MGKLKKVFTSRCKVWSLQYSSLVLPMLALSAAKGVKANLGRNIYHSSFLFGAPGGLLAKKHGCAAWAADGGREGGGGGAHQPLGRGRPTLRHRLVAPEHRETTFKNLCTIRDLRGSVMLAAPPLFGRPMTESCDGELLQLITKIVSKGGVLGKYTALQRNNT